MDYIICIEPEGVNSYPFARVNSLLALNRQCVMCMMIVLFRLNLKETEKIIQSDQILIEFVSVMENAVVRE